MAAALVRGWHWFADVGGAFIEEAAFRTSLVWAVLRGRSPKPVETRWWNRATETPLLLDVWDWPTERHVFSVLVWPSLEVPPEKAPYAQQERAKQVMRVIPTPAPLRWPGARANRECVCKEPTPLLVRFLFGEGGVDGMVNDAQARRVSGTTACA
jgi:hypothetical protein